MEPCRLCLESSRRNGLLALRLSAARAILLLLGVLLAVGPFTERFCGWDHFLTTGRDFEFTVLGVLLFCGLTLLAACKASLRLSPLRALCGLLCRGTVRMLLRFTGSALLHEPGSGVAALSRPALALRV